MNGGFLFGADMERLSEEYVSKIEDDLARMEKQCFLLGERHNSAVALLCVALEKALNTAEVLSRECQTKNYKGSGEYQDILAAQYILRLYQWRHMA